MSRLSTTIELWNDETGDLETVTVPATYVVCDRCEGHGHVDNLGPMTGDEYWEMVDGDPDFPEHYKRGDYDVPCPECKGNRVVAEINRDQIAPELIKRIEDRENSLAEMRADQEAERRYFAAFER